MWFLLRNKLNEKWPLLCKEQHKNQLKDTTEDRCEISGGKIQYCKISPLRKESLLFWVLAKFQWVFSFAGRLYCGDCIKIPNKKPPQQHVFGKVFVTLSLEGWCCSQPALRSLLILRFCTAERMLCHFWAWTSRDFSHCCFVHETSAAAKWTS